MAARQLVHFDHSFKAELHTTSGALFTDIFGVCVGQSRSVQLTLKATALDIMEDVLTSRKFLEVKYSDVSMNCLVLCYFCFV